MIDDTAIEAYNARITATLNDIAKMTAAQRDRVKNHGSKAEALLKNADLVMFIHQFRFEVADALAGISGHDPDSNNRRVALSNHLSGIDSFIATLQRAVYMKNRVVSAAEEGPHAGHPTVTKEVYKP